MIRHHRKLSFLLAMFVLSFAASAHAAPYSFSFNGPPEVYCQSEGEYLCFLDDGESAVQVSHGPLVSTTQVQQAGGHLEIYIDNSGPLVNRMYFRGTELDVTGIRFSVTVPAGQNAITFTPRLVGGELDTELAITVSGNSTNVCVGFSGSFYQGVEITSPNYLNSSKVQWDDLVLNDGACNAPPVYGPNDRSISNVPIPTGENVPQVELNHFQSTASNVLTAGTLDADFCYARDPRETTFKNKPVYVFRVLQLKELADQGTCTGPIATGAATPGGIGTWFHLLKASNLTIDPWFRAFKGKPKTGPFQGVEGYWIVIGSIRTTAQFDGAVGVFPIPENLIDYGSQLAVAKGGAPSQLDCNKPLDNRPLSLGGTVAAFGDWMNVEGGQMIQESVQCDGPVSMTRRTTHAYPMRLDGFLLDEAVNLAVQFDGLGRTLNAVATCSNDAVTLNKMRTALTAAKLAVLLRNWNVAIGKLEQIASFAQDTLGYGGCPEQANYRGGLVARSIAVAFTVHDRFKYRSSGPTWRTYYPPAGIALPLVFTP